MAKSTMLLHLKDIVGGLSETRLSFVVGYKMSPLYKLCQEPSPSVKDTTCFIIILQHTIIMATDSQQTLYDGGILYLTTKLSLVSDSPPTMSLRCNGMVDSTMALDFVTSQALRCPIESLKSQFPLMEKAYGMGSVVEVALSLLRGLYDSENMLTRSDEESGERWLEGRLQVESEEAENDALQALFKPTLKDKYSGPPFRKKPIFYCLDEDWNNNLLRSYRLKICEKRWSNRIHVCHEIFMVQVTTAFVKQEESSVSFLEHS
ncbi:hypothetical protein ACFX12_033029 [Malus domestica]